MKSQYFAGFVSVAFGGALVVAVLMLAARASQPVHAAPTLARRQYCPG
jgi:hypothetical protein